MITHKYVLEMVRSRLVITHKYVLEMVRSRLQALTDARVNVIQFIDRNTIHGTRGTGYSTSACLPTSPCASSTTSCIAFNY